MHTHLPYDIITLRYKLTTTLEITVNQTRWTSLLQVQTSGRLLSFAGMCGGEIKAAIVPLFL